MSGYAEEDLNQFVRGYVEATLFFEEPPEAEGDEDWVEGDSYWEAGFRYESVDPASIARIRTACAAVLDEGHDLIPGGRLYVEGSEMGHAGHDAALTAQRILDGFGGDRWRQPTGQRLTEIVDRHLGWDLEPWRGVVHIGRD